ncbi:hypothetical protein F4553_000522 [Allocatelliglobosispora scoriae]|uniref:Sulfotransferase domain-containing protein n=1 Tax=Allocatelliglobosispora scoriae TaxID=643052 RepID=A0A841BJD0_9ACTN|nr:hypothetical protein [Allocatelliglobosispora scoriae]MBB5867143.1 hypothetical protein [Allocatelliglobosispora scoriae]
MLRAFFGRHRTGSTWSRSILADATIALGLTTLTVHVPEQWDGYATIGDKVRAEKPDVLVMTNCRQEDFDSLPPLVGLNVIRDPRDIIVSGYFSHLHSHPEKLFGITFTNLVEHRKALKELSEDEGLYREIEFSGLFLDPMSAWNYANPGVLELRMEEILADTRGSWDRALRHLGLVVPAKGERLRTAAFHWNLAPRRRTPKPLALARRVLPRAPLHALPSTYVDSAVNRFTFAKMSKGRQPGQVDVTSHYRRGIPGDWPDHLTDDHLKAISARYGDLVERLGYGATQQR